MARMEQYRAIDEKYADIRQIEMQITTWERNKRGEVTKKSTPLGGESHYKYDPLGNLVSQIDEDGLETLYEYNLANRLEKVAYADGKTVELGYNARNQLVRTLTKENGANIEALITLRKQNKLATSLHMTQQVCCTK